jgi:hypothetical protein
MLSAAANIGALLCDGIGDAILVRGEPGPGASVRLAFNILQSVGNRIFKTDYVACPSCGRTLFNLQTTTAKIRESTNHLKGVKIAIMGCIVNGPGEMADADFGYVGGAPGKVNLYIGKTPVKFNIPEGEAVDRLVDLIKENGKWFDAPVPVQAKLHKRSLNQELIGYLEEKTGMDERQKAFADAIQFRNKLARRGFKIPPGMEPEKLIREDRDSR